MMKNNHLLENRFISLLLLSILVLLVSCYFQYVLMMVPCPLCLMQRLCVFLLAVTCGFGLFFFKRKPQLIVICYFILSLAGLFFSGRQLWLQSLPSGLAPACMPELSILVKYFSLKDILHALFLGAGDCAEVTWTWLGISMAGWSFLYFLVMFISGVWLPQKPRRWFN